MFHSIQLKPKSTLLISSYEKRTYGNGTKRLRYVWHVSGNERIKEY